MIANKKRASILSNVLVYDRTNNHAYLSNRRSWENTLLCEKSLLTEFSISYPSLNRGEDSVFVEKIKKAKVPSVVHHTINPKLYVYCYTGSNTYDAKHFNGIFSWSQRLPALHSAVVQRALSSDVDMFEASAMLDAADFSKALPHAIDRNDVSLDAALPGEASIVANLAELNAHDLSPLRFSSLSADGRFGHADLPRYWSEPNRRFAFLIRYKNDVAGFVLITRDEISDELHLAEFFVARRYRLLGIGRRAAHLLWDRFAGRWSMRVSDGNKEAIQFLRTTIAEYSNGRFSEQVCSGDMRSQWLFSFDNSTLPTASQ
jgi:predicted acetyltransferase